MGLYISSKESVAETMMPSLNMAIASAVLLARWAGERCFFIIGNLPEAYPVFVSLLNKFYRGIQPKNIKSS
jgi:hypothetical protein